MNLHFLLSGLLTATTLAIALGSANAVMAQGLNALDNGEDLLPATGNIRDLDGLEERRVNDWFPQNGISEGAPSGVLKMNQDALPSPVVDPQIIRNQDDDWRRNTSGDPKQTGGGIPLGEF